MTCRMTVTAVTLLLVWTRGGLAQPRGSLAGTVCEGLAGGGCSGLEGAVVRFTNDESDISLKTGHEGTFKQYLLPATYKVEPSFKGYTVVTVLGAQVIGGYDRLLGKLKLNTRSPIKPKGVAPPDPPDGVGGRSLSFAPGEFQIIFVMARTQKDDQARVDPQAPVGPTHLAITTSPLIQVSARSLVSEGQGPSVTVRAAADGTAQIVVPAAWTHVLLQAEKEGYESSIKVLDLHGGPQPEKLDLRILPAFHSVSDEAMERSVLSPSALRQIPVAGARSFDALALLLPGVAPPPQTRGETGGPSVSVGVGSAGQFAVNGVRSRENNFVMDGSDNNDEEFGTRRQGYLIPVPQPLDTIDEVQLITALPDARFGRSLGTQVNALSRPGGSHLRGHLYGFLTDQIWNARDYFGGSRPAALTNPGVRIDGQPIPLFNGARKDPFRRDIVGAYLGGPLHSFTGVGKRGAESQTHVFLSFERQDVAASRTMHFAVPLAAQRSMFAAGDPGLPRSAPTSTPLSATGNAIFSLYPFPNDPSGPYGANTYSASRDAGGSGTIAAARLDHQFSIGGLEQNLVLRYNQLVERSTLPATGEAIASALEPHVRTQNAASFFTTRISPSIYNVFRFSFGRTAYDFRDAETRVASGYHSAFLLNGDILWNVTPQGQADGPSDFIRASSAGDGERLLALTSLYRKTPMTEAALGAVGRLQIAGFSPVGVDPFAFPQKRANRTFQFADQATASKGKHNLTAGFDIRRIQLDSQSQRNARPSLEFHGLFASGGSSYLSPLTMAAAGIPTELLHTLVAPTQTFNPGTFGANPEFPLYLRKSQGEAYFLDEFHVSQGLSLSLGVRLGWAGLPKDVNSLFAQGFDRGKRLEEAKAVYDSAVCSDGRCPTLLAAIQNAFPAEFAEVFGRDRFQSDGRVGLAWRPREDSEWMLRGGVATMTSQFPAVIVGESRSLLPQFLALNYAAPPRDGASQLVNYSLPDSPKPFLVPGSLNLIDPSQAPAGNPNPLALLAAGFKSNPALALVQPGPAMKIPYVFQGAFRVERSFGKHAGLAAGYVGTLGRKLLRLASPDLGQARASYSNLAFSSGAFPTLDVTLKAAQVLNQNYFTIARTLFESSSTSSYHALQSEFHGEFRGGFRLMNAFTWSHAIDDASDFMATAGAPALAQNSARRDERAASAFDIRRRNVATLQWDTSEIRMTRNWLSQLAGMWTLSGIFTLQDGQPYTVTSAFDVNQDGNLTDRLQTTTGLLPERNALLQLGDRVAPRSLLASAGSDGALGRNTFRARGLAQIDGAAERVFHLDGLSARLLRFRAEAYNLSNRPQFAIPVTMLEAPGFGHAARLTNPQRMLQLALKLEF